MKTLLRTDTRRRETKLKPHPRQREALKKGGAVRVYIKAMGRASNAN